MIKQSILTLLSLGLLSMVLMAYTNATDINMTENNITDDSNQSIKANIEANTGRCIGCHGENFEKHAMGVSNIVKDMTKAYIEATLFNYKYESNDGNMDALMAWQTSQLSNEEIRAIARKIGK